jgi:hypothetical protein
MKSRERETGEFEITDKLKERALELLDETHAMQFAEGLRLNNALATVFGREQKRLEAKYGANDSRPQEMGVRLEASGQAKVELFARYSDAMTPTTPVEEGWAVDGFVRTADGKPVEGLMVAAFDKNGEIHKDLGRSATDQRGFFSIKLEKLPEKVPDVVFMRAARGSRLLESKEARLTPKAGASERVDIILIERGGGGDKPEKPVTPDKPIVVVAEKPDKPSQPDKPSEPDKTSVPVAGTTAQPDKATVPAPDKPVQPDKPVVAVVTEKPAEPVKPSVIAASKPSVVIAKPKAAKRTAKAKPKSTSKKTSTAKSPGKSRAKRSKTKK